MITIIFKATNILVQTKVKRGKLSPKITDVNGGKKQTVIANKKDEKNLFFTPRKIQDLFETFLACDIFERAYSIRFVVYLNTNIKSIKIKSPIQNFVLAESIFQ
ncbi:MAG: hypothetical protein II183_03290 [Elusimicrobiaceae bacterium]|nr:hypothetical protein [Elusimicrobiaceae bacterium]